MPLSNSMSTAVAAILSVGVFAGMQLYRHQLAASGPLTLLGGFLASLLFIFVLTAVGNLELMLFGPGFQTSLTEVAICLVVALVAAARVHGVCVTTCFIFSLIALYYVNRISQKTYSIQAPVSHSQVSSKKKK